MELYRFIAKMIINRNAKKSTQERYEKSRGITKKIEKLEKSEPPK